MVVEKVKLFNDLMWLMSVGVIGLDVREGRPGFLGVGTTLTYTHLTLVLSDFRPERVRTGEALSQVEEVKSCAVGELFRGWTQGPLQKLNQTLGEVFLNLIQPGRVVGSLPAGCGGKICEIVAFRVPCMLDYGVVKGAAALKVETFICASLGVVVANTEVPHSFERLRSQFRGKP